MEEPRTSPKMAAWGGRESAFARIKIRMNLLTDKRAHVRLNREIRTGAPAGRREGGDGHSRDSRLVAILRFLFNLLGRGHGVVIRQKLKAEQPIKFHCKHAFAIQSDRRSWRIARGMANFAPRE